ncbi:NAD(P)H nitroreductase [Mycobacterium sp. 852002-51057_SCH5723018]|uniref:Acg family FMN-binding oxidoreductase n=1 Tax=Mycobacterium sp. 852002-51057_SCH5723018 TaxID=1834094 RepID=UPI0007FE9833|nr:NAD(P)H nitroreductase [Mycobacterium sp. 852002-51057_SCH5723018]OBG29609.1 NAD(P)H nitroreductase [Mycobacterium sp. 852002-51057_SCH5723018]
MLMKAPKPGVLRDAVMLASRAPSLHNSRPWRWVVEGGRLHLWADPRRMVHATDRTGREMTLSCGAVLDHVRVAMAAAGWDSATERLPDPAEPDHLASLRFRPLAAVTQADQERAAAIRRRRTDRLPFAAPRAWPALENALRRSVLPLEVMLDVVEDDARPTLGAASRLGEALRRYDTTYLSELRWWTAPFESDATHVPASALLCGSRGERRAAVDRDHSTILLLSTHHDDARLDVLRCGEALSAVLLDCTVAGMATCTLTHMTEMAVSRNTIAQITGTADRPQLLIRVGKSPADGHHVEPTGRRLLTEVIQFRA